MSRTEWWVLVWLGIAADIALVGILIYVRFIWDLQQKQWNQMWMDRYDDAAGTTKLYLGDEEDRERRHRPRDLYRPQG